MGEGRPASFTDVVQRTIEQPYTAVAIALAIGWLLGRTYCFPAPGPA